MQNNIEISLESIVIHRRGCIALFHIVLVGDFFRKGNTQKTIIDRQKQDEEFNKVNDQKYITTKCVRLR